MKTLILSSCITIFLSPSFAQKVGIGIAAPQFKLDVRNGSINTDSVYRLGGGTFLSGKGGNCLVGAGDGVAITSGIFNIAIGLAQEGVSSGSHNIGLGFNVLDNNGTGSHNIGIGSRALEYYTGSDNIAIGRDALGFCSTGNSNTAIGIRSQSLVNLGNFNTALGYWTLTQLTSQGHSTAIGYEALKVSTAWSNTAVGSQALQSNTTGTYNTAMGWRAQEHTTTGERNTAVGTMALWNATTGVQNTAIGYTAAGGNSTGSYNTAAGDFSLNGNRFGTSNCGFGVKALYFNEGSQNTAIGTNAMYSTIAADFSTAVGFNAGANYEAGWNNTLIGAEADISFNGQYNAIAIGNLAKSADHSKVRIGNSAHWSYEAFANWTNISDGRYKKNIQENVVGLDFIMKLRPVNYQMDVTGLSAKFNERISREHDENMKNAWAEKEKMTWTGFVAQEVESAAKETNFQFSGVDKPRTEQGVYGLRYAEFVVPLVKAVQEQQQTIEGLRQENEILKTRLEKLEMHTGLKAGNPVSKK
ncbi:MAG: tail fiber domain-containing protein [Bacteroidota bacterium]